MFKFRHRNNAYFRWGLTAFCTVVAILAVYDIFLGNHKIVGYGATLAAVVTPVAVGGAIAYLLRRWAQEGIAARKPKGWVRLVSVLLTLVLLLGAIVLLLCFLIPDVATSIMQLIENIPMYVAVVHGWFDSLNHEVTLPPDLVQRVETVYAQAE